VSPAGETRLKGRELCGVFGPRLGVIDEQLLSIRVGHVKPTAPQMQFSHYGVPHVAGACRSVADIGAGRQHSESLAAVRKVAHNVLEVRVTGLGGGNVPAAADNASGGVIPVDVEVTLVWIEEQLAQQADTADQLGESARANELDATTSR
jgi:hypothetical protein